MTNSLYPFRANGDGLFFFKEAFDAKQVKNDPRRVGGGEKFVIFNGAIGINKDIYAVCKFSERYRFQPGCNGSACCRRHRLRFSSRLFCLGFNNLFSGG